MISGRVMCSSTLVWYVILVSVILGVYSPSSRQARYESSIDTAVKNSLARCLDR
jgi:hypothetical protein